MKVTRPQLVRAQLIQPFNFNVPLLATACAYDRFVINQGPLQDIVANATIFTFDTCKCMDVVLNQKNFSRLDF